MAQKFQPKIAIIGAGLASIALSVRLKKAGFNDFVILEADDGPGGTWWSNRYPGAESDIHTAIYSLPFKDHQWTRTHARQPELLDYVQETIDQYDIRGHMRFGVRVEEVRWIEEQKSYVLRTAHGEETMYNVVVSAVGMLSDPRMPDWKGKEDFQGAFFHTQRWPQDLDLTGKRVAVVGVGATSAQVVPSIAPDVGQLYVFQRQPHWTLPKNDRDYTEAEMRKFANPVARWIRRAYLLWKTEWAHIYQPIHVENSKRNKRGKARALQLLETTFADRPDLKEAFTPDYVFSGKRRVLTDVFFPAFLRDNVELVPHAVTELTANGIIDATGQEREVDIVVAATGFNATSFLSTLNVFGRQNKDLQEEWREGAYAFFGIAVPDFPNFYMMFGPNTNGGGPVTYMQDQQVRYIVGNLKWMARTGATAIDVKPAYMWRYYNWLQTRLKNTAWAAGQSYFRHSSGRVVTQWRDGILLYGSLTRLSRRPASRKV